MKVVFDTEIIKEIMEDRKPQAADSKAIMQLVANGTIQGGITANAVIEIYQILKAKIDPISVASTMKNIIEFYEVIEVTKHHCFLATELTWIGYEEAVLACAATGWRADYLITWNTTAYLGSGVPALSPVDFLVEVVGEM